MCVCGPAQGLTSTLYERENLQSTTYSRQADSRVGAVTAKREIHTRK